MGGAYCQPTHCVRTAKLTMTIILECKKHNNNNNKNKNAFTFLIILFGLPVRLTVQTNDPPTYIVMFLLHDESVTLIYFLLLNEQQGIQNCKRLL